MYRVFHFRYLCGVFALFMKKFLLGFRKCTCSFEVKDSSSKTFIAHLVFGIQDEIDKYFLRNNMSQVYLKSFRKSLNVFLNFFPYDPVSLLDIY